MTDGTLPSVHRLLGAAIVVCLAGKVAAQPVSCDEGFRAFDHAAGSTCVPENPQRIIALQDQNALLPLLELGITPLGASGIFGPDGEPFFRGTQGYDTSDVVFLGHHRQEDVELVASLEPDLIVATPSPDWHYPVFSKIAPTVVIDMFSDDFRGALHQFAALVGREERALELEQMLDRRVAALQAEMGRDPSTVTASFVLNNGAFRVMPWVQGFGEAFRLSGVSRPPWEVENVGIRVVEKSLETLDDHLSDVLFVVDFSGDDSSDGEFERLASHPVLRLTPMGKAGQIFQLDATQMGGTSWLRTLNGVEQIAEHLSDPELKTDIVVEGR